MSNRITYTEESLRFAYNIAKAVYEEHLEERAYKLKSSEYGFGWSSFRNYFIPAFRYMREGKVFKGGLPESIKRYYFDNIFRDYGIEGLELALKSFKGTIDYYKNTGQPRIKDSLLYDEYIRKLVG